MFFCCALCTLHLDAATEGPLLFTYRFAPSCGPYYLFGACNS